VLLIYSVKSSPPLVTTLFIRQTVASAKISPSHLHEQQQHNNMADIKNSTRIDTAVAIMDVESSLEPSVHKAIEENNIDDDESAGMVGMGIAMLILILVGTVSSFFIPYLSSACYFAFILTCEC
jgi:hypothetical protein